MDIQASHSTAVH